MAADRYAAFISYSHAVDGRLAPAVQSALHRFAKPWYRTRALRVFRDEASLSANPALWASIEAALAASDFLILLASPDAASSAWVGKEVDYWCRHRPLAKLLIVLTDGDMVWDSDVNDFDWSKTNALPVRPQAMFDQEPRFVDLRWARSEEHLSLSHPRFRDNIADLAAPLHGRAKDEIVGDDVREHRRLVRLVRLVITMLCVSVVVASSAAVVASGTRNGR